MNLTKAILFKGTIYQLIGRFSSVVFTIVITIFLARTSGIEALADYSIVMAYVAIFLAISEFGVNTRTLNLFKSDDLLKSNFKKLIGLRLVISTVVWTTAVVTLPIWQFDSLINNAILLGLTALFINAFMRAFNVLFQVKSDFSPYAIASGLTYSVGLFVSLYFIMSGGLSLMGLVIIYLLIQMGILLYLLSRYSLYVFNSDSVLLDWSFNKKVFSDIWIFGVVMILNLLMFSIDKLFLAKYSDSINIAGYATAYRIFELALILPAYVMNLYFPHLIIKEDSTTLTRLQGTNKSLKYLLVLSMPIALIFMIGAYSIPYIWGSDLTISIIALQILAIGIPIFYITSPLGWFWATEGKYKILVGAYSVALLVNVIGNYFFIPTFGFKSAALFTLISELIVLLFFILPFINLKNRSSNVKE